MGAISFQTVKASRLYWETTPDNFVLARSDSLPRNTFEHILRNLHLCDREQLRQILEAPFRDQ